MKTLMITIAAMLIAAPLCFASTTGLTRAPLTDAGPDGIHPAEMSLPGVVAEVDLAMGPATDAETKIVQAEGKRLHPSQLSLEGELPTAQSAEQASYPLTRELWLVRAGNARPEVESFVRFALSAAGQQIVGQRYGRIR